MSELLIWWAYPIIFFIGFLHSSVGLAGGSVYSVFFSILGFPTASIPSMSLSINTCNSSIGSYHFIQQGHLYFHILWPFLIGSIPASILGAQFVLPELVFHLLLLFTLICALLRMTFLKNIQLQLHLTRLKQIYTSILLGALLGFLSGSLGIGGGIYLIPILLILGIAPLQQAAAIGIVFIFLNSFFGLISRGFYSFNSNHSSFNFHLDLLFLLPIMLALSGAFIGSRIGSRIQNKIYLEQCLCITLGIGILLMIRKIMIGVHS